MAMLRFKQEFHFSLSRHDIRLRLDLVISELSENSRRTTVRDPALVPA